MKKISLSIDEKRYEFEIPDSMTLFELLKNELKLDLNGDWQGCPESATSVYFNGLLVYPSLILAAECDASEIYIA